MNDRLIFSYWEREEWLKPPALLIVGAGIVGASTALFYKRKFPGRDVLIVDRGFAPNGASTRNAGFACIGSVSEHVADIGVAGEDVVFERIKRRWEGLKLLRQEMGDESLSYDPSGGFEIFTNQEDYRRCSAEIGRLNRVLNDLTGVNSVYSTTDVNGYPAIKNSVEGSINSGMLMRNLHQKLAKLGVRVWWNCAVVKVEEGLVTFGNGFQLAVHNIALCVNGFQSALVKSKIKPARGYVFVTKSINNLKWRGTFHYDRGYVYFRDVGDDCLLLGGGRNVDIKEETTDQFGINPGIKSYLIDFANNVLQLPEGWAIDTEWSGIMGMTENKEPVIEKVSTGIWSAAGLSGMGIAIGMKVAQELTEKIP